MAQPDRTWVEIDLEAIRTNARTVAAAAKGARLLPMVKANAYGLGAVPVARSLEALDPWGYGVASADEGRELRESGIARPILVLEPSYAMLESCVAQRLTPVLGSVDLVRLWRGLGGERPFHVQVDTGMNRSGIWWKDFASTISHFAGAPGFEGLCTHFHSAERDAASVKQQWERFESALGSLPRRPKVVHAANSAATLNHPETAGDVVRPGIFLYGGSVGAHSPRPVVTWRALISRHRWVEPGETVSYGGAWRADSRTLLVTVSAGYADGFRRSLSGRGAVLINGCRGRVVGAVTMDSAMVALTPAEESAEEELDPTVTLLGNDGQDDAITLDEMAAAAGTISYEILTGLGKRVERVYR